MNNQEEALESSSLLFHKIYQRIATVEADIKVLKNDVNLLNNGLFSERKRNSSILKRIRQLKEDPEVQEILEALQYYKNPEKQQDLVPPDIAASWSVGQPIGREHLLNRQRAQLQSDQ